MKKILQCAVLVSAAMAAGSAMAAVTFYEADDFLGQPFAANGAIPDFRAYNYNDRAMSMVVEGSPVEVCADINFSGQCQVFTPGRYPSLIGLGWTHTISSVRPARGYDARSYSRYGYSQQAAPQVPVDPRDHTYGGYDRGQGYGDGPFQGYPGYQGGYQGYQGGYQGYQGGYSGSNRWPRDASRGY